jgi:signal peptidase II
VKFKHVIILTLIILIFDQALKIWVKTNFYLGKEIIIFPNWFRFHFVENEGMAYGWKLGGQWGKILLTTFRMAAVVFGTFYLKHIISRKYHNGYVLAATLIYAGAIGNLIDSMFYGLIFENSDPLMQNISSIFPAKGYAGFLHGKVVDMLYFPIITNTHFPKWLPIWGGQEFEFFRPVFNIADASISIGVLSILLFQNRFFREKEVIEHPTVQTGSTVNDKVQIM